MTMSIEIRKIGAEDVTTLRELAMATFSQTFKDEYTKKSLKLILKQPYRRIRCGRNL